MPYCGNQYVSPGSVCSDGSMPTATRGGGPAKPAEGATSVVTAKPPIAQSPSDGAVYAGEFRPDRGEKFRLPKYVSMSAAERQWLNIPSKRREQIEDLAKRIDYRKTGKSLYLEAIGAAEQSRSRGTDITPLGVIAQLERELDSEGMAAGLEQGPGGGTRGRAAAYTGPVESVAVQAETDIIATAQAAAQTFLGRSATQEELDKILKRTRKAEQAQPTVQTRQGPGRVTTEEGLTRDGRDAIARKVLMASPDYAGYQIDSTVMDMLSNIFREGQEVARG